MEYGTAVLDVVYARSRPVREVEPILVDAARSVGARMLAKR